jgi:hypothetical protein
MKTKFLFHYKFKAFTLIGLITTIVIICVVAYVICSVKRLAQLKARELPDENLEQVITNNFGTNWQNPSSLYTPPWPVKWTFAGLDTVTKDPVGPIVEKVFISPDCLVQICKDGTLTNWATVFKWTYWGGSSLLSGEDGIPTVGGSSLFEDEDGTTYQMKKDLSGFEINPREMTNQTGVFWRTLK